MIPPISLPRGLRWYLARTARHHEIAARDCVQALGVETYLPMERHIARHGRRLMAVELPLFRQYLFVRMDLNRDPWWDVRRAQWMEDIVSSQQIPTRIPDMQIDALREAEINGAYDSTRKQPKSPIFPNGSKVKITGGPFQGFVAKVISAAPDQRVEILLDMFGRGTKIRIEAIDLVNS